MKLMRLSNLFLNKKMGLVNFIQQKDITTELCMTPHYVGLRLSVVVGIQ